MPAYEVGSGSAIATVEAYCRHLCGTAGFGTATQPTAVEVGAYRDMAYYKIAGMLGQVGYAAAQTDPEVLGLLQNLQVIETVISVELSYPITGPGEPNERFMEFARQRDQLYAMIDSQALETLGATRGRSTYVDVTGVSIARKQSVEQDSDLVQSRFRRDQFAQQGQRASLPREADTLG